MSDAHEQEVLARPDDDAPRERLARELVHRGDPRGEFISLQLEVARIRRTTDVTAAAWSARWLRGEALREAHGASWIPSLPAYASEPRFVRGFVEHVTVDAAAFAADPEPLFRAAPVRRLTLRDSASAMASVVTCSSLARMIALDFHGERIGDSGAAALGASRHVIRVVWLDLTANDIGAPGLAAVLASPHLEQLAYCAFALNRVASPEEGHGVELGVAATVDGDDTVAIESTYGPRPWLRAPSLHPHAYPPGPDDLLGGSPAGR